MKKQMITTVYDDISRPLFFYSFHNLIAYKMNNIKQMLPKFVYLNKNKKTKKIINHFKLMELKRFPCVCWLFLYKFYMHSNKKWR